MTAIVFHLNPPPPLPNKTKNKPKIKNSNNNHFSQIQDVSQVSRIDDWTGYKISNDSLLEEDLVHFHIYNLHEPITGHCV